jgi:Mg-chelatase subunit ChlD
MKAIPVVAAAVLGFGCGICASAAKEEAAAPRSAGQIEVCFVLDTTGSMGGLIEGAKRKIWSIANDIASAKPAPKVKFGLVGYRDRGDDYIVRTYPLTDDLDSIYEKLQKFEASGGGDTPESVNQALNEAVTAMPWNSDRKVLKIVFLVGDAPPHMDYQDDVKYTDVCKAAVAKDIIVNTIQCGNQADTTPVWQDIANRSEGAFAAIGQSGDMIVVATPFDSRIAELHAKIAGTRLGYGDAGELRAEAAMSRSIAASAPASTGAARAAFKAKMAEGRRDAWVAGDREALAELGEDARDGRADLLDAFEHKALKPDDLDQSKMPAEMRGMDRKQMEEFVAKRLAERKELEKQLAGLNSEREQFLKQDAEKRAKESPAAGFDAEVGKMIRDEAARKGIVYE